MSMIGHNNPPPKTIAEMSADERIMAWNQSKVNLEAAKVVEKELRTVVLADQFTQPDAGTNRVQLGKGWELKGSFNVTYSFIKDMDAVAAALAHIPVDVLATFVSWEYKLSSTGYKELPESYQQFLASVIDMKNESPQLELIKPKV